MKLIDLFEMKYNLGIPKVGADTDLTRYMKSKLPNFPDYVLRDWIKELVANKEEFDQLLNELPQRYGPLDKIAWTKEPQVLDFSLDKFDDYTKKKIELRQGGEVNPSKIPGDVERHQTQAGLIKGKNPKDIIIREPVIVFKRGKQYELIEGWHRTIQALKHYPDGYRGYAFIGKPGR